MTTEVQTHAWTPRQMEPGTIYLLAQAEDDSVVNPFRAVLACPVCGALGLMTRTQYYGLDSIICSAQGCSAEYTLVGDLIHFRPVQ